MFLLRSVGGKLFFLAAAFSSVICLACAPHVACIICPRQVDVHVLFKPGHYDLLYPGCFNVTNRIGGFPCWDRFPKAPIGMGVIFFCQGGTEQSHLQL